MLAPLSIRLAALATLLSPAFAQTIGAASVVNRFGLHQDGNAFVRKDGSYLSVGSGGGCSGPGACTAPGLADGEYYFQLTDPAGTVLLTPDPLSERRVRVAGGRIAEYFGTTRISGQGGACGETIVRFVPYDTTPYPGDEYKVWLTRVENFDASGAGIFGFDPRRSESDSFRVRSGVQQSVIRGHAFFDENQSGTWTPGRNSFEVALGGWRIELLRNGVLDGVTYTDADGAYAFIRDRDGAAYTVRQAAPGGFINDHLAGAVWLATTPIEVQVSASSECVAGPELGAVVFELLPGAGRPREFWESYNCHYKPEDNPNFPCGETLLEQCEPAWRGVITTRNGSPVSLRKPISIDLPSASVFAPPPVGVDFHHAFLEWRNFVRTHPNDHAGFLLSREIACTLLNHSDCGFMQGVLYIDRHQDGVLEPLEGMLDGAIGLLNETGAGLTGPFDPFQDLRQRMIMCTNEFRTINQTADPAAPQVVYARRNGPLFYETPY